MAAIHMLFGTGMGLLSLFTLVFMVVMAIYLFVTLSKKSRHPGDE